MGANPYGTAAQVYWKKAWYPFPVKAKHEAIPTGVTGIAAKDVSWAQIQTWIDKRPFSNVAVRASGWIAIDVDGHEGICALARAEEDLGGLPDTWTSSSWGPSGGEAERLQFFFRIPTGFSARLAEGRFRERFGKAVDIIHRGHRYSVVAPSIHPDTGNPYAWYGPDGEPAKVPVRTELPELPLSWLEFLEEQTPAGDSSGPNSFSSGVDWYEDAPDAADHGWTDTAARAEVERMLGRIRTADNNVNTSAGGAMREVGRFVPALFSMDEAIALCRDALLENPWHSDGWNAANGKAWTAATLAATSVTRGAEEARRVVPAGEAPEPQREDERYTDAFMSERLAREALAGRFIYTSALGWLKYDGTRWAPVEDETVNETARQWTIDGWSAAVDAYRKAKQAGTIDHAWGDDPDIAGWQRLQGRTRISGIVALARGIDSVYRDASVFDTDPALLNTPSGVVDLRTGVAREHSPTDLITKITGVGYDPAAESPALKAALDALPEGVVDWLQLMLGEAVTGNSGERMVLFTGGGRNGKTLLMGSIYTALGAYAQKVPSTLLMRSKQAGAATPEKMTLRGIRLAYMEETPEDGYLDANMVKDLLDAKVIEGRHLYKNVVTWTPTHSIFLSTNHPPTVSDTGEGTWRRMARVDFPYRYRKAHEPLERPTDRVGDPRLGRALGSSQEGQGALLAWLVAGAVRYYAAGSIEDAGPDPDPVVASIRRWRADSDDVLRFMDEVMDFDPDAWVSGADLYREFAAWQRNGGQHVLSAKSFSGRMESHTGLPAFVAKVSWMKDRAGLSRPGLLLDGLAQVLPDRVKGWAGLAFKINNQGWELDE